MIPHGTKTQLYHREATSVKQRRDERTSRIQANIADGFSDAEQWNLEFWKRQSPQDRLSALVALRNDLKAVHDNGDTLDWSD